MAAPLEHTESWSHLRRVTESLMQRGRICGADWQNLQRGMAEALVQNADPPLQSGRVSRAEWQSLTVDLAENKISLSEHGAFPPAPTVPPSLPSLLPPFLPTNADGYNLIV